MSLAVKETSSVHCIIKKKRNISVNKDEKSILRSEFKQLVSYHFITPHFLSMYYCLINEIFFFA